MNAKRALQRTLDESSSRFYIRNFKTKQHCHYDVLKKTFLGSTNPDNAELGSAADCYIATGLNSEVAFILVLTALVAVLELCKLIITPKLYIRRWSTIGSWILIGLVVLTTVPNLTRQTSIGTYQYQAAAVRDH